MTGDRLTPSEPHETDLGDQTYQTVPIPNDEVTMARTRQALRCSAHKTNGEPCRAWAMVGVTVCRVHGGSAPQARVAAYNRITEADIRRSFDRAYGQYVKEWREWQTRRVVEAAELLGLPVADLFYPDGQVNGLLMAWCRQEHGRPDGPETEPTIRYDGRFRAEKNRPKRRAPA